MVESIIVNRSVTPGVAKLPMVMAIEVGDGLEVPSRDSKWPLVQRVKIQRFRGRCVDRVLVWVAGKSARDM